MTANDHDIKPGDRVCKRGSDYEGIVVEVRPPISWISVCWDDGIKPKVRPLWCRPHELYKVTPP